MNPENLELYYGYINMYAKSKLDLIDYTLIVRELCLNVIDEINELSGIQFQVKPAVSLIDKLYYRSLDVHDLIRGRVLPGDVERVKLAIEASGFFNLYDLKRNKKGEFKSAIYQTWIFYDITGSSASGYGQSIFLELQAENNEFEGHFAYELSRIQMGTRFIKVLQKHGYREAEVAVAPLIGNLHHLNAD
jgi:hypothetical protein